MIVKAGRADLVTADTAQDELTRLGWPPALLVTVLAEHEGLKLMRLLRFVGLPAEICGLFYPEKLPYNQSNF